MRTLSLVQTAGLIADIESMPGELVPLQLRRIRMLATKDLIPVERETTGRQEGKLTFEGVCRARLASVLIDLGFDAETLRSVSAYFNGGRHKSGDRTHFELAARIVAANEPLPISLHLDLWLDLASGRKRIGVSIPGVEPKGERAARANVAAFPRISQAKVEVPLNALWLPIHEYFEAL